MEEHIRFFANTKTQDEIGERRVGWFTLAAALLRASTLANKERQFEDHAAQMWLHLAEGCQYLRAALQNNVLWSDDEKAWFAPVYDEREGRSFDPIADGRKYCLNHVMPKWLLNSPAINEYADRENISLMGKLWATKEHPGYLVARGDLPHARA